MAKPDHDDGRLLTPEEAADYLSVSRRWIVKEGVYKRGIPHIRPPNSSILRFRKEDLDTVIRAWRHGAVVDASPPKRRGRGRSRR